MYVIPTQKLAAVAVFGSDELFPVHRIYCVGRNYADHAKEMGMEVNREQPMFFTKPADAVVASGSDVPYPPATNDLHHEVELVVALKSGGANIAASAALNHVYGYALGLDLTRRDLQAAAKSKGWPWDIAKGFDYSAPIAAIATVESVGHISSGEIWLDIDGVRKQSADVDTMIFSIPELIQALSKLYTLQAGDLIFTGTPAGVSAMQRGQQFVAGLGKLPKLTGKIV